MADITATTPAARIPRVLRLPRSALVLGGLFAAAALIAGFTLLQGVDPFDEGLVLQAAHRVAEGQLPYRDFTWAYGPAEPYLLAGLFKAFGVSLVQWRVLWMLANAGTALVAYGLVRRFAPAWVALLAWLACACALAWLACACALAEPRTANPFPYALLGALAALLVATGDSPARRRALWAGVLTAAAAAFRLDFALYGLAAVAVALALEPRGRRAAALYLGTAVGLGALVYLPFLIADGPGGLYDSLVGTSLRERDYWTLPFPWSYHGGVGSPEGIKHLIDFYVPALLLAGLALAALGGALRGLRERRVPGLWAGLAVFGLGGLSYLLSRTDEFHTAPLLVTLAVLLPLVAVWALGPARPRGGRGLAAAAIAVFALLLVHGVANRISALTRPPQLAAVHVPGADGAEAPPAEARAIERVVALVHQRVPPGQPIYVAPARSDLIRFNNSLLYVLAGRDNATDRDFGLLTSAAAQRSLVAQLERTRPRVVVRWTDPLGSVREPNLRGRSSGVHTLDRFLAARYRPLAVLYHYTVLVPR